MTANFQIFQVNSQCVAGVFVVNKLHKIFAQLDVSIQDILQTRGNFSLVLRHFPGEASLTQLCSAENDKTELECRERATCGETETGK